MKNPDRQVLQIDIPNGAREIMELLLENGYESYIVGGSVRDALMGKLPNDWDICTSAYPEKVMEIMRPFYVIPTGLKYGTVTVVRDGKPYEVTTFRVDGDYLDFRKPEDVIFVSDVKEDLARRDFTINAIAYNNRDGLVDPYSGLNDIKAGVVRAVGSPKDRFNEDALRILRGLRFASRLGFKIEDATGEAIKSNAHLLERISAERIRDEFSRILMGDYGTDILREYRDVIAVFLPEIKEMFDLNQKNKFHIYDVWEHTLHVVDAVPKNIILKLAGFFHDIGKPRCLFIEDGVGHFYGHEKLSSDIADDIMKRLKYDNITREKVTGTIKNHMIIFNPESRQPNRLLNRMGEENLKLLIELEKADVNSQNPKFAQERLENIQNFKDRVDEIIAEGDCFSIKDMKINGRDIIAMGVPEGRFIGEILQTLMDKVLEGEIDNQREMLINEGKKIKSNLMD